MTRNLAIYSTISSRICDFISKKQSGQLRHLIVGRDNDYVVTVRAIKKVGHKKNREHLVIFIDESGFISGDAW